MERDDFHPPRDDAWREAADVPLGAYGLPVWLRVYVGDVPAAVGPGTALGYIHGPTSIEVIAETVSPAGRLVTLGPSQWQPAIQR
jgi:hypothetical protein